MRSRCRRIKVSRHWSVRIFLVRDAGSSDHLEPVSGHKTIKHFLLQVTDCTVSKSHLVIVVSFLAIHRLYDRNEDVGTT